MKKKILLSLLVVVALFTITACGSSKKNEKSEDIKTYEVTINGLTVEYDEKVTVRDVTALKDSTDVNELIDIFMNNIKFN